MDWSSLSFNFITSRSKANQVNQIKNLSSYTINNNPIFHFIVRHIGMN